MLNVQKQVLVLLLLLLIPTQLLAWKGFVVPVELEKDRARLDSFADEQTGSLYHIMQKTQNGKQIYQLVKEEPLKLPSPMAFEVRDNFFQRTNHNYSVKVNLFDSNARKLYLFLYSHKDKTDKLIIINLNIAIGQSGRKQVITNFVKNHLGNQYINRFAVMSGSTGYIFGTKKYDATNIVATRSILRFTTIPSLSLEVLPNAKLPVQLEEPGHYLFSMPMVLHKKLNAVHIFGMKFAHEVCDNSTFYFDINNEKLIRNPDHTMYSNCYEYDLFKILPVYKANDDLIYFASKGAIGSAYHWKYGFGLKSKNYPSSEYYDETPPVIAHPGIDGFIIGEKGKYIYWKP